MDNGASSYRRFLEGDDQGIVEIIRDYKDRLMLYLNSIAENMELAEEWMEETFVKLVTKRPRFSGRSSFKTWLYAIGRNVALDQFRRHRKISVTPLDEYESLAEETDLEREYLQEEEKIQLHRALRELNPDYRQILHLVYFEDFSNAQAAAILKKSRRQVETLLYRARNALKSQLESEGFLYENL